MRSRVRAVFSLLEDISAKLASMPCMRLLSQAEDKAQVSVSALEAGGVTSDLVFSTVSPALAFQVMQNLTDDNLKTTSLPYFGVKLSKCLPYVCL